MSSDVYALLDSEATVYLFKHCKTIVVIDDAPTLEDAVNALLRAAPPKTIKGVYILSFSQFERCRRSVEAVQRAGYSIIELVETLRFCMSSFIYNLPLKQTIGSTIFVVADSKGQTPIAQSKFTVLRKCEKGWQHVQTLQTPFDALADHPSVTEVVFPQNISEADKAMLKLIFPSSKLHPSPMMQPGWLTTFFQNRINNGDLNGYEVQQFCPFNLIIKHGSFSAVVRLKDTPPFTITEDVDVGHAPEVEIRCAAPNAGETSLVKTFKFKSAKFRTVEITISVDKTLMPEVSLMTIATRESDAFTVFSLLTGKAAIQKPKTDVSPPIVFYTVMDAVDKFFTSIYYDTEDGVGGFLPSIDDTVARLKMETSTLNSGSNTPIVFHYTEFCTTSRRRSFREACQKAGLRNVTLISFETMTFSLLFEYLQITVNPGQLVAVLSSKFFCIVTRDGRNLKVIDGGPLNKFNIKQWKIESAIVANVYDEFPKAALAALRRSLQSVKVHMVSGFQSLDEYIPQFLRRFVDATVSKTYTFNDFCDFDIDVGGRKLISTRFKEIPYSVSEDVDVSGKSMLEVNLVKSDSNKELLKTFTVKRGTKFVRIMINVESTCDITVTMEAVNKASGSGTTKTVTSQTVEPAQRNSAKTCATDKPSAAAVQRLRDNDVDKGSTATLPNELSQLQLDPPPTTILTFTSDNRVLIKADKTYTGVKEVLAYVRLQAGKAPIVGQQALDALQTHPESVFYGITRLLTPDFDPNHPNLSWRFKTLRDADGKVVIRGGDGITTFPIVLFGLVVRSTLLYIQEHVKSEITTLGIQLPMGSTISDADLNLVAQRIGVALVIC